jgi:hypothetical protein
MVEASASIVRSTSQHEPFSAAWSAYVNAHAEAGVGDRGVSLGLGARAEVRGHIAANLDGDGDGNAEARAALNASLAAAVEAHLVGRLDRAGLAASAALAARITAKFDAEFTLRGETLYGAADVLPQPFLRPVARALLRDCDVTASLGAEASLAFMADASLIVGGSLFPDSPDDPGARITALYHAAAGFVFAAGCTGTLSFDFPDAVAVLADAAQEIATQAGTQLSQSKARQLGELTDLIVSAAATAATTVLTGNPAEETARTILQSVRDVALDMVLSAAIEGGFAGAAKVIRDALMDPERSFGQWKTRVAAALNQAADALDQLAEADDEELFELLVTIAGALEDAAADAAENDPLVGFTEKVSVVAAAAVLSASILGLPRPTLPPSLARRIARSVNTDPLSLTGTHLVQFLAQEVLADLYVPELDWLIKVYPNAAAMLQHLWDLSPAGVSDPVVEVGRIFEAVGDLIKKQIQRMPAELRPYVRLLVDMALEAIPAVVSASGDAERRQARDLLDSLAISVVLRALLGVAKVGGTQALTSAADRLKSINPNSPDLASLYSLGKAQLVPITPELIKSVCWQLGGTLEDVDKYVHQPTIQAAERLLSFADGAGRDDQLARIRDTDEPRVGFGELAKVVVDDIGLKGAEFAGHMVLRSLAIGGEVLVAAADMVSAGLVSDAREIARTADEMIKAAEAADDVYEDIMKAFLSNGPVRESKLVALHDALYLLADTFADFITAVVDMALDLVRHLLDIATLWLIELFAHDQIDKAIEGIRDRVHSYVQHLVRQMADQIVSHLREVAQDADVWVDDVTFERQMRQQLLETHSIPDLTMPNVGGGPDTVALTGDILAQTTFDRAMASPSYRAHVKAVKDEALRQRAQVKQAVEAQAVLESNQSNVDELKAYRAQRQKVNGKLSVDVIGLDEGKHYPNGVEFSVRIKGASKEYLRPQPLLRVHASRWVSRIDHALWREEGEYLVGDFYLLPSEHFDDPIRLLPRASDLVPYPIPPRIPIPVPSRPIPWPAPDGDIPEPWPRRLGGGPPTPISPKTPVPLPVPSLRQGTDGLPNGRPRSPDQAINLGTYAGWPSSPAAMSYMGPRATTYPVPPGTTVATSVPRGIVLRSRPTRRSRAGARNALPYRSADSPAGFHRARAAQPISIATAATGGVGPHPNADVVALTDLGTWIAIPRPDAAQRVASNLSTAQRARNPQPDGWGNAAGRGPVIIPLSRLRNRRQRLQVERVARTLPGSGYAELSAEASDMLTADGAAKLEQLQPLIVPPGQMLHFMVAVANEPAEGDDAVIATWPTPGPDGKTRALTIYS